MTATNNNTVQGELPETIAAYNTLANLAAYDGITFHVADYGGLRDEATTTQLIAWRDQAVAAGEPSYRVAPYGHSYHDYGGAFDLVIDSDGGFSDPLAQLGTLAPQAGLRWGGTFPPPGDRPHFELAIDIGDLKARWAAFTGQGQSLASSDGGMVESGTSGLAVLAVIGLVALGMARRI